MWCPDAPFGGGIEFNLLAVQPLDEFQCFPGGDGLGPASLFAGGKIGLERLVGLGKAAAQGSGQLGGVHLPAGQAREVQGVAAETLEGDGDRGRSGTCSLVEGAESVQKLDGSRAN